MISIRNAASSHIGWIPLKTGGTKKEGNCSGQLQVRIRLFGQVSLMGFRAVTQARPGIFHGNNGYHPWLFRLALDPIGQNPLGHLMKFTRHRISYRYGLEYWL